MIKLLQSQIDDRNTRLNFETIQKFINSFALFLGNFQFIELTFDAAVTNLRYKHNLGILPRDLIQTSFIGTGTVTWNYGLFDKEYLDVTATSAGTVRAFVGAYPEGGI